jgi:hypothetical protein
MAKRWARVKWPFNDKQGTHVADRIAAAVAAT